MLLIRKATERGHADHGWLNTYHTFSFAGYYDQKQMGFRELRVINEDRVQPKEGFPTHPHRDMEIVTYVLEGALEHKDSMGNGSVIRPGEVQRMSAGTGITHSEFNHSGSEPVHFLQIWILPEKKGVTPGYEQTFFPDEEKRKNLRLIASPDGRNGSVTIKQDVNLYAALLEAGEEVIHHVPKHRHAWLQVARGSVEMNGHHLEAGDGAAVSDESQLLVTGREKAEVLLFDLA
ncbi:redox-sensitive bicupin YhaK, pirin superfamily [Desulfuromonas soudanensis]|uniref:Redox-sensitive bicupin YhaK, pirin superfamily n=1 Tax=Desulfuromonas soudanensis TaxID=1603606 RepID=A0A0M4CZ14_9BACT|nr:pirin family protein [Desulfuromonas soudanensis]ALC17854.1 redox-sensitive bicupin YhaK, pirin superfamily [Desulfuromonas soudanensis]